MKCQQFPRVRASTIKDAFNLDMRAIDPAAKLFGSSPTAAEARHFISLTALKTHDDASSPHIKLLAQFMYDSVRQTVSGLAAAQEA